MSCTCQFPGLNVFRLAQRVVVTALIVCLSVLNLGHVQSALAKAPPHATTIVTTQVFATPDLTANPIDTLSAGEQLELTGNAAPGFLGVVYEDGEAWVPSTNLTTGVRPGVDTALAIVETPLTSAPIRDSGIITYVPEGESVILTGAEVDGYYAASYDGFGGWIKGWDIAR